MSDQERIEMLQAWAYWKRLTLDKYAAQQSTDESWESESNLVASVQFVLARIQELEVENARLWAKIEWAAHACINEMVDADETGQESDFAYNRACEDCAAAVLKGKPLESPAPTPEPREGGE